MASSSSGNTSIASSSTSPPSNPAPSPFDLQEEEREKIFSYAVEAVKQCQNTFGGKSQLAADTDTTVSILLLRLERIFQHGLKQRLTKAVIDGAFRQITELSGINLNYMKPELGEDVVFWSFVKNFLNKDELARFMALKNITSEFGRGRAWVRAALNEHNLDRYVSMILADPLLTKQFYEPYAFLLDTEKAATLPQMISSLRNIYFALKIDNSDLDFGRNLATVADFSESPDIGLDKAGANKIQQRQESLLLRTDSSGSSEKRRKHKKKKLAKIEELSRNNQVPSLFGTQGSSAISAPTSSSLGQGYDQTLDPFQISDSSAPPDLIPIFEKLEINHPMGRLDMSSQNSESLDDGSGITGVSGSLELLEDSGDYVGSELGGAMGGASSVDSLHQSTIRGGAGRRPGHHRSQSDNAAKLQAIKMEFANGSNSATSSLTSEEMKQAVLDMMRRKDEFERENNSLKDQLRQEKAYSEGLQKVLDSTKQELDTLQSTSEEVESSLRKEVDVLKGQLKRYVSAVNTLKQDRKATVKAAVQDATSNIEIDSACSSHDALDNLSRTSSVEGESSGYEAKLIAMSGLHAELLELNEQLQSENMSKERTIHHLRNEINVLRGPLPGNEFLTVEDLAAMFVNVWIPSSFLRQSHQIYHVHIRVKNEEWRIFKRYQQFHDFHNSLKKEYPVVDTFEFPPKTIMRNKDATFVEERKQSLQRYLQKTTNFLVRQHSRIRTQLSKDVLINFLPFFSPVHNAFTVNR